MIAAPWVRSARFGFLSPNLARYPRSLGSGSILLNHALFASLLAFLKSPASYPHRPAEVRSTETHISWVFFASPFAYKVKKPVDLGFLDFSTLERRRHLCEREVQLNRRLCPDVYLGVTPIYQDTNGLSFEEKGGAVAQYAVKMRGVSEGFS